MSTGADTKANMWGGGAPEVGDLRLLEDGSDCGGALGFDFGATETAGEVQSEDGERAVVSRGTDAKAIIWGVVANRDRDGASRVC